VRWLNMSGEFMVNCAEDLLGCSGGANRCRIFRLYCIRFRLARCQSISPEGLGMPSGDPRCWRVRACQDRPRSWSSYGMVRLYDHLEQRARPEKPTIHLSQLKAIPENKGERCPFTNLLHVLCGAHCNGASTSNGSATSPISGCRGA
jgi:hypothetical protein